MANNIILCGYRGSGKTSIGRKLANQLWKTFVDVDDETCKRFNDNSIANIWKEHGEPAWRVAEVDVTRQLVAQKDMVIGLGGGTLMQQGARDAVENADAVCIYLKCQPAELFKRITADTRSADTRPNLTNKGGGIEEIETMLAERGPVYEAIADRVLDVTHLDIESATRYLIKNCL